MFDYMHIQRQVNYNNTKIWAEVMEANHRSSRSVPVTALLSFFLALKQFLLPFSSELYFAVFSVDLFYCFTAFTCSVLICTQMLSAQGSFFVNARPYTYRTSFAHKPDQVFYRSSVIFRS